MASLDILCFKPFNLKNKIMKIGHKKIFLGPSKILKNISWPINVCLKYFLAPAKTLRRPREKSNTLQVYLLLRELIKNRSIVLTLFLKKAKKLHNNCFLN